jgi:uncharacterized protein
MPREGALILDLEVQNFMSLRDTQRVELAVGAAVEQSDRSAPAWQGSEFRVSKVAAFFGPNASGKSTVLRALPFLAAFLKESFQLSPDASLNCETFGETKSQDSPTRFSVGFPGPEVLTEQSVADPMGAGCRYNYELQLTHRGGRRVVLSESLHYWPSSTKRKTRLFERNASGEVAAGKEFYLSKHRSVLKSILRDNASVISTLAQLDHGPSLMFRNAAGQIVSNIFMEKTVVDETAMLRFYQANPTVLASVNTDLKRIDLGIRSMAIHLGTTGPMATFEHEGLSKPVPLHLESHGTRQFLQIYPWIIGALATGGVAVLDEMDIAIHPHVLPEILRWFYSGTRNPKGAQLWMSCQNASLLEELDKDEVWFCEKDRSGATTVYGLREIAGVRRVDNFYRKYMSGTYGAVPTIG